MHRRHPWALMHSRLQTLPRLLTSKQSPNCHFPGDSLPLVPKRVSATQLPSSSKLQRFPRIPIRMERILMRSWLQLQLFQRPLAVSRAADVAIGCFDFEARCTR